MVFFLTVGLFYLNCRQLSGKVVIFTDNFDVITVGVPFNIILMMLMMTFKKIPILVIGCVPTLNYDTRACLIQLG